VTIVPFPAPPAGTPASGEIVTAAVDRYLDSIKTRTTRSSYAGTLARLVSRADGRDTARTGRTRRPGQPAHRREDGKPGRPEPGGRAEGRPAPV
jgi:hypothetical protein